MTANTIILDDYEEVCVECRSGLNTTGHKIDFDTMYQITHCVICQCNVASTIERHHIIPTAYSKILGFKIHEIIYVCANCHKIIHALPSYTRRKLLNGSSFTDVPNYGAECVHMFPRHIAYILNNTIFKENVVLKEDYIIYEIEEFINSMCRNVGINHSNDGCTKYTTKYGKLTDMIENFKESDYNAVCVTRFIRKHEKQIIDVLKEEIMLHVGNERYGSLTAKKKRGF